MPDARPFAAVLIALVGALSLPTPGAAQAGAYLAELTDDRIPTSTVKTVSVQETTYRQEWSTEMVETPVRRWVPVTESVTTMQQPTVPHPRAGNAPWLVNVPVVTGWRLEEGKVRTPVTTSRIVPEVRTVQKEVRVLAFEPGARALARNAPPVQPILGATSTATVPPANGDPRVASGANTTIPSTTVPARPAAPAFSPTPTATPVPPLGGGGGFPTAPFPGAAPTSSPLRGPAPTPWTPPAAGLTPLWGGLQRLDVAPAPTADLGGAPGGLRY